MPLEQMEMSLYDILQDMECRGLLQPLATAGVVPISVMGRKDIYECYMHHIERGESTGEAVLSTTVDKNVSRALVYLVISDMRKKVQIDES